MNILLGVGNPFLGDDGAGCFVADKFSEEGWKCYNCGTTPENITGIVRREKPERVFIIDAADMGIIPGELRIILKEKIEDAGIGTHQLSLSHLLTYLENIAGEVVLIGIQPENTEFSNNGHFPDNHGLSDGGHNSEYDFLPGDYNLSVSVERGAGKLISMLKRNKLNIEIW
jgi:hydrogenase 3 maturation protease